MIKPVKGKGRRKKLNYYTPNEIVNAIFNNDKSILNKVAFIT